jgi:ABC-type multidrug transport system fused ATPase/permease subunit
MSSGAGKSSLLAALYRLVEPEMGSIVIDGIETRRLGLQDLR